MDVVAGIDGGGTRSRVALATRAGTLLGVGEAGPGNLHDVGTGGLRTHLGAAWAAAWERVGEPPRPALAAFCGMASVVTEADRGRVREVVGALAIAPPESVGVDHDLRIALAGGLGGAPGIVLIAGTGSSCYGRAADGRTWAAGGWGSFLDDRGSALDLGRGALMACARAADERGPATALAPRLKQHLGLVEWRELLRLVDAEGFSRARIAALAPLVTEAAAAGDAVARRILSDGAAELALAVEAVARHLEWSAPDVVPSGGLAHSGPTYRVPLEAAIHARLPGARIVDPALPPVLGAVLLALESLGVSGVQSELARSSGASSAAP